MSILFRKKVTKKVLFSIPTRKIEDGEIFVYATKIPKIIVAFYKEKNRVINFSPGDYFAKNILIVDPSFSLLWATHYGGSVGGGCL